MKIKCFDNMAKKYATSSDSKGKVSNDQKQFQVCTITSIVHKQSHKTVSTSSYVSQNKVFHQSAYLICSP